MRGVLRHQRLLAAGTIVAIAAGTAIFVYARRDPSATPQYRTTSATLGAVTQTLALSGNLTPVNQTNLHFGASGTVSQVNVQVGQSVKSGDVLASLDQSALQKSLTQAQADLQSAQTRLSLDQAGPTAQSLAQSQGQVSSAQVALQKAQGGLNDTIAANQQSVAQAQSTVTAADSAVRADHTAFDADMAALQAAQQKQASDCAGSTPSPTPSPSPTPTPTPSPGPSPTCIQDQQTVAADTKKVADDQQNITRDQGTLAAAQQTLDATRTKAQQSLHQAQAVVDAARTQSQNAQDALTALQQGRPSQQQVQVDVNQVQTDLVTVDAATRALQQTTLTAPVDGAVAAVNIVTGQSVAAGSGAGNSSPSPSSAASTAIVLLTPGAFQVTGTASDSQAHEVAVGQRALVTPAGSAEAINARVTEISPRATGSSGAASFAVTATLDRRNPSLHAGASASISVIVHQVAQVLTVPTSAVRGGSVQVLLKGQLQILPITVGASDAFRTQVVSGLKQGDTVVVATVSGTVPAPNNNGGSGTIILGGDAPGGPGRSGGG